MKSIFEHQLPLSGMGFLVKEYLQPHFTSPFHFHDLYELTLIQKSYGKLYAGRKVMNFNDYDVYMFGPGFAHCFYNEKSFISSGETAHAIVIFFKGDFLGENLLLSEEMINIRELLQKAAFGIKVNQSDALMRSLFTKVTQEKGLDSLLTFLKLLNLLSKQKANLSLISPGISKYALTDADSEKLEPVFKYVIENFKEDLTSKYAASLACLNETSFCRYFKHRTEQTFSQFVNRVRITHATSLLLEEEWDISRVCYECGFRNLSYFNRQFKTLIGQSPIAYRKAFQHDDDKLIIRSEKD